jgi:hypothetical protein
MMQAGAGFDRDAGQHVEDSSGVVEQSAAAASRWEN